METFLPNYVWIAVGSALGGMLRFWLGSEITAIGESSFPWGTLAVNVIGGGVIGAASEWSALPSVRFFVMVGLCGGFTTFSSYSLETLRLLREANYARALLYSLGSVLLCLLSVWLGNVVGKSLRQ